MILFHFSREEKGGDSETTSLPIRVFYKRGRVHKKIHRIMLLGKEAGSEASVGGKPAKRVSLQECPAVSGSFPEQFPQPEMEERHLVFFLLQILKKIGNLETRRGFERVRP